MAKQFEYEQSLKHLKMTIDEIKTMLDSKPIQYAYIVHDKDIDTDPHIHVMVKLLNSNMSPKDLCKWFKDKPQYINIKQSRWGNKLRYLCHRTENSKHKYQYDPVEVVANFDYISTLENITIEVEKAQNIDKIIELIEQGVIREYNLTEYVDANTYSKHKVRILNAIEWYRRKVMTDKNRNIKVIMFSGATGTGKTTYAKHLCEEWHKTYCISSTSNDPMQDYKGEDVLILDEIRDSTFKYSDFLKILDNHTKSTIQSRYSNKAFIGDTIILTTPDSLMKWYEGKTEEDRAQLYRRITEWYHFTKTEINCFIYNKETQRPKLAMVIPNILKQTIKESKSKMLDTVQAMGITVTDEIKEEFMRATDYDNKTIEEVMKNNEIE